MLAFQEQSCTSVQHTRCIVRPICVATTKSTDHFVTVTILDTIATGDDTDLEGLGNSEPTFQITSSNEFSNLALKQRLRKSTSSS